MTVAFFRDPTLAKGWMENLAMMRWETLGPMPKKDSRERFTSVASVKEKPFMKTWVGRGRLAFVDCEMAAQNAGGASKVFERLLYAP